MPSRGILALLAMMVLTGCGFFAQDRCLDHGGVWFAERKQCFCAENFDDVPADERTEAQIIEDEVCSTEFTGEGVSRRLKEVEREGLN